MRCTFALVALTLCDTVSAQVNVAATPLGTAVVCNPTKIALCNVTAYLAVQTATLTKEQLCLAVHKYAKCRVEWLNNVADGHSCSDEEKSKWMVEENTLQTYLNLQKGTDCSSVDLTPPAETASSGNSGSESSGSSGSDKISFGSYYWQWLLTIVCICAICGGAVTGVLIFMMKGKKKGRGAKKEEGDEEEEEEEEEDEEFDEEERIALQETESQAIPMATPGNALETGVLQSNQTASMTLTDPTYMPNTGYAP